jgi:pyridoxine 5-phosphate synthase
MKLHVNVDHVATLRQARGTTYPDPVWAASLVELAGGDGITVHLREDRRHIQDRDVRILRQTVRGVVNLEMAATDEMVRIAREIKPDVVTLVPEKREERTTEGGIDAAGQHNRLQSIVSALGAARIRVSMFIEPDRRQLDASKALGAPVVELHTGAYANAGAADRERLLDKIRDAAAYGESIGLEIHAGHGLTYDNVKPVAAIPQIRELNIGHFLIGEAVFIGLDASIREMRRLMDEAHAT